MINFKLLKDPCKIHIDFISKELKYPLDVYFIYTTGAICWHTTINNENTWVEGPPDNELHVRIVDRLGDLAFSYNWIFSESSDIIEKKFVSWCRDFLSNNGYKPKGIAVGTNDGQTGEWVEAYNQNLIGETLLIEPNIVSFIKLTNNYSHDSLFTFKKCVIGDVDGEVDFFTNESGTSESSSLIESNFMKNHKTSKKIKVVSYTPQTLMKDKVPDWIHIDAEGYDGKIILLFDEQILQKLKFIIWEHIHLTDEISELVNEKLNKFNFTIIKGKGYNTCAYKMA